MLKSLLRRALAAVGVVTVAAAPVPANAKAANPALWAVSDADTTIYLFGTIHLLPDNYQWRSAKLDQAVANSQQLMVETIIDESKPQEMMGAMASLAFSPNLRPIAQRVPPAKR